MPGISLPASLTIVTRVTVPVSAVTTTRARGSTSASGLGVMVNLAGSVGDACGTPWGGAANVWQCSAQSGRAETTTPPDTASTASATAR